MDVWLWLRAKSLCSSDRHVGSKRGRLEKKASNTVICLLEHVSYKPPPPPSLDLNSYKQDKTQLLHMLGFLCYWQTQKFSYASIYFCLDVCTKSQP